MKGKRITRLLSRRSVLLVLTVVLVLSAVYSGTMAWLIARTEPVVNTFAYGDINIGLDESDTGDGDSDPNTNRYEMLPGTQIAKDPEITIDAESVDCWVFVKLEKSANFDDFMEYEIAEGWTALPGEDGVYYRQASRSEQDQTFQVLMGDAVSVKESVTKEMLNELDANGAANYPTLTVTGYAVQRAGFDTAAAAWAQVNPAEPPAP